MADITEIRDHQPGWCSHQAQCCDCSHVWTAVFPKEKWLGLECPKCGLMAGTSMIPEKQNTQGLFDVLRFATEHGFGKYGKEAKARKQKRWSFGGRTFVYDE